MSGSSVPAVAYLGFCERAAYVRDGNTNLFKWNVLGLKQVVLSHVFPLSLRGYAVGLALFQPVVGTSLNLRLVSTSGAEAGKIEITLAGGSPSDEDASLDRRSPLLMIPNQGWVIAFLPLSGDAITVKEPGLYDVVLEDAEGGNAVGQVLFALIDPPPLSPERIRAIRSDPNAAKAVRAEFKCKICDDSLRFYAGLERTDELEEEGYSWYQEVPDRFKCSCEETSFDLTTFKRNFHGLLGVTVTGEKALSCIPLYELGALEGVRVEFRELLEGNPREEAIQSFLEENPVIFHQFPSLEIHSKPPILNRYVADFGILTPGRDLLLIEIEKPDTRLLKKNGGAAAPLQHAIGQVTDWLHQADEHRVAFLDGIGVKRDNVGAVKGVVIAGRDSDYDPEHLRKLKGIDRGRVTFLTYDDLLASMAALIERVKAL